MKDNTTGGPAFPEAYYPTPQSDAPDYRVGMTLRDYFAAQALIGFLADGSQRKIAQAIEESADRALIQDTKALAAVVNEQIAEGVYALADAMLEARK